LSLLDATEHTFTPETLIPEALRLCEYNEILQFPFHPFVMSKPTEAAADRLGLLVSKVVLEALESSHADEVQPATNKDLRKESGENGVRVHA
jgi:hypothetical protein